MVSKWCNYKEVAKRKKEEKDKFWFNNIIADLVKSDMKLWLTTLNCCDDIEWKYKSWQIPKLTGDTMTDIELYKTYVMTLVAHSKIEEQNEEIEKLEKKVERYKTGLFWSLYDAMVVVGIVLFWIWLYRFEEWWGFLTVSFCGVFLYLYLKGKIKEL